MSKGHWYDFDAAGWIFWGVATLILIVPAIWLSKQIVDPHVSVVYSLVIGAVGAVIGASVVSTCVNYLLQNRRKKQKLAERKKTKKRK